MLNAMNTLHSLRNYTESLFIAARRINSSYPRIPPRWIKTHEFAKQELSSDQFIAYHGTGHSRISTQLSNKQIENQHKPFYVTMNIHQAGAYADSYPDPIILQVRGSMENCYTDSVFRTLYCAGISLKIEAVYHLNPDYAKAIEARPSWSEWIKEVLACASKLRKDKNLNNGYI